MKLEKNNSAVNCKIRKCSHCNSFNLDYKLIRIHVDYETLQFILTTLYQYDLLCEETKKEKPFRIKIDPVLITVNFDDYTQFKEEVEKIVLEKLNIPKFNIFNYSNN